MTYSGWIKPKRGQWKEVARHATEKGCWAATLAHKVAGDCERQVRPTGSPPAGAVKPKPQPGLFDQEAQG